MILGAAGPDRVECSRAGCREDAVFQVNWRNPRIHSLDRVKVWAACAEHVDFLADFVRSRDFPVAVTALGETVDTVGAESGS
ncbi:hypothetical protein [Frondihabitans peucedani]|uniref:Acetone carboxylase n=1 Tax=Frondihabitans peucedani TaxID=598626 RepID=A0ABP8DXQ0_9MICO